MSRRFLLTLTTIIVIGVSAGVAILLTKGFTFSPKEGRLVGTGIISITSKPDAASVYLDGHLTTATDATISSLTPRKYKVRLAKEGFIPWEKEVEVREGLVTDLKVTLFPAIPTLYPLTFNGVKAPLLSPDSSKLAFIVPVSTESASIRRKAGVWVWTLQSDQPIAFARGAEPHQIARTEIVDYSEANLKWSADSKQILATVGSNNYLLNEGVFNDEPRDITPVLEQTLKSWDEDSKDKDGARVLAIKDLKVRNIASSAANLRWSPDETKFMYTSSVIASESTTLASRSEPESIEEDSGQARMTEEKANFKVYDLETNKEYDIPSAKYHFWLPTSGHIVLVEDNQISIVDFDGINKAIVYAGNFEDSLVFAWPDSSRLVFISSFPTPTASSPNLYGINLK